ncbi:HNH endonuclease signature motif containing protein [Plantactinospora solaniradicis]|uniref:HNH endonuclease signature motif containing protein n=1 Tax=Plantactinospora solaniradicis TaxID=1723736 RepID=A0ABW1K9F5_9ACTN
MVATGTETQSLKQRFRNKVRVDLVTGCWMWTASVDNHGYGQINVAGAPVKAHRVSWMLFVGPIPDGLTLDHLCRVVRCVSPDHLDPVTRSENTSRQIAAIGHPNALKTECTNGHGFSETNTRYASRGRGRVCRICRAEANKRYRQGRRAA